MEINTREHFAIEGYQRVDFSLKARWFSGTCRVTTFSLNELLATKMRALFQRRKGRDLFDLWLGMQQETANSLGITTIFDRYMKAGGTPVSRTEYLDNVAAKLKHPGFLSDLPPLLVEGAPAYDPQTAFAILRDRLFVHLG